MGRGREEDRVAALKKFTAHSQHAACQARKKHRMLQDDVTVLLGSSVWGGDSDKAVGGVWQVKLRGSDG